MFKPIKAVIQNEKFGDKFRLLRKEKKLSQEEVAKYSSVNVQTVKRIEDGKNVSLITILKICNAIDINIVELVGGINELADMLKEMAYLN